MTPAARGTWPSFVGAVHTRLEAGARAYGNRSFAASPEALALEVQQELLDVCGWSFVLWVRLEAIREALGGAGTARSAAVTSTTDISTQENASTADNRATRYASAPTSSTVVSMMPGGSIGIGGSGGSGSTSAARRYGPTTERYAGDGVAPVMFPCRLEGDCEALEGATDGDHGRSNSATPIVTNTMATASQRSQTTDPRAATASASTRATTGPGSTSGSSGCGATASGSTSAGSRYATPETYAQEADES